MRRGRYGGTSEGLLCTCKINVVFLKLTLIFPFFPSFILVNVFKVAIQSFFSSYLLQASSVLPSPGDNIFMEVILKYCSAHTDSPVNSTWVEICFCLKHHWLYGTTKLQYAKQNRSIANVQHFLRPSEKLGQNLVYELHLQ